MYLEAVSSNILEAKAKSKVEMFDLLTVNRNLFLPRLREALIYFIRDILEQRKKTTD